MLNSNVSISKHLCLCKPDRHTDVQNIHKIDAH